MLKILSIENGKENKFLHSKTKEVDLDGFDKKELRKLIKDMRETMHKAHGIGLAGNQVGLNMSFFVARNNGKFYSIFNPKITKYLGEAYEAEEGCLSFPGHYGYAMRYPEVILEGLNQNGKKLKIKASGLLAHIFQHEVDHLDGVLIVDYK